VFTPKAFTRCKVNNFARNGLTLLRTREMLPWWLRWQMRRRFGVSLAVKIPFGGTIRAFSSFSDFWSIYRMIPSIPESRLIGRVVTRFSVNFDVGANVGVFTLAIAKACQEADVYSFEPAPETFNRLQTNVELNRSLNAHPRRLALGSKPGRGLLQIDPRSPATNRLSGPGNADRNCVEVEVQTVDAQLRQVEGRDLGLLKIDVEGFECDVLMGAADSLRDNRWAAVLIEICPANLRQAGRSVADLVAICESFGYSLFEVSPEGGRGRQLLKGQIESIALANALICRPATAR